VLGGGIYLRELPLDEPLTESLLPTRFAEGTTQLLTRAINMSGFCACLTRKGPGRHAHLFRFGASDGAAAFELKQRHVLQARTGA
jgi:hypothetical protein